VYNSNIQVAFFVAPNRLKLLKIALPQIINRSDFSRYYVLGTCKIYVSIYKVVYIMF